jgi:LacI family transcriptional regulator
VVYHAQKAGWIIDARSITYSDLPPMFDTDGIIGCAGSSDVYGPRLRAAGLPLVNIGPWGSSFYKAVVRLDNHREGVMAADHLIGRGFQHLTMARFFPGSITANARQQGFEETVMAAGRTSHRLVNPMNGVDQQKPSQMTGWLKQAIIGFPRPLGVFTEGDEWAAEVIHACQEMGLRVPEDVAVLGINNDPLVVKVAPVSISSVDSNRHELGRRAAELLERLIAGEPCPEGPILVSPRGVIERQSTNVYAVSSDEVSLALKFIHTHFREPIGLDDMLRWHPMPPAGDYRTYF